MISRDEPFSARCLAALSWPESKCLASAVQPGDYLPPQPALSNGSTSCGAFFLGFFDSNPVDGRLMLRVDRGPSGNVAYLPKYASVLVHRVTE